MLKTNEAMFAGDASCDYIHRVRKHQMIRKQVKRSQISRSSSPYNIYWFLNGIEKGTMFYICISNNIEKNEKS